MTVAIKYNIGDKHRHWTILGEAKGPKKKRYVTAKCDCGFETVMLLTLVRNGKSKYCRVCVKKGLMIMNTNKQNQNTGTSQ